MASQFGVFRIGALSTGRVEAFSDGVLAVVITLLVLDVKLPTGLTSDAELWRALLRITPVLGAWVVSFAFVLTFWVSHHYFFASLKHTDRGLLWFNGLFLLCVTLIPFPAGLVGQYPGLQAPLALLCCAMMLASLSFTAMRAYATFKGKLLKESIDARQAWIGIVQSALAPILYAVATGVSLWWPPGAIAIQVLVLVTFFLRSSSRHTAPDAGATQ